MVIGHCGEVNHPHVRIADVDIGVPHVSRDTDDPRVLGTENDLADLATGRAVWPHVVADNLHPAIQQKIAILVQFVQTPPFGAAGTDCVRIHKVNRIRVPAPARVKQLGYRAAIVDMGPALMLSRAIGILMDRRAVCLDRCRIRDRSCKSLAKQAIIVGHGELPLFEMAL